MQYLDGNLILDKDEVSLLSLAFMCDAKTTYPASTLMAELNTIKAEAEAHIQKIALQEMPERRRSLQISMLKLLISTCEVFKEKGYASAQAAGCSIQRH